MTEEEKIYKYLQNVRVDRLPLENEIFAIRDSRKKTNDYTIYVDGYISLDAINKNIEKLNLIQKQQEEIEKLRNKNKDLLRKLRNRVKEVKKLTKYSLYKEEFSRLNAIIEKKDKIIDEMAGYLSTRTWATCPNEDCGANLDCENRCDVGFEEECWKQYFERKAEV